MRYEYDEIEVAIKTSGNSKYNWYIFGPHGSHSLLSLLNRIGEDGWELVGEIGGIIIVKRKRELL
ncbi:hypothetical protein Goe26_01880 [Bacillus phage vB_BsuM-Goe26]|nr:hypothetical protein Goe26_01880 [Bacillus phage vB_BsuM-Goe26]